MRQNVFCCRPQPPSNSIANHRIADAFGHRQTVSRASRIRSIRYRTRCSLQNQARRSPFPVFCRYSEKLTAVFQALKHQRPAIRLTGVYGLWNGGGTKPGGHPRTVYAHGSHACVCAPGRSAEMYVSRARSHENLLENQGRCIVICPVQVNETERLPPDGVFFSTSRFVEGVLISLRAAKNTDIRGGH